MLAQLLSRVQLLDSMDCSPPSFSARGIVQARILEWVAISSSGDLSRTRDQTTSMGLLRVKSDTLSLVIMTLHIVNQSC